MPAVKKKIVVRKVVKKVKRAKGFLDEVAAPAVPKADEVSDDAQSDDELLDREVKRRRTLKNEDVLSSFVERASGFFIEAEIPPPREVPLIGADLKQALKLRREKQVAAREESNSPGGGLARSSSAVPLPETPAGFRGDPRDSFDTPPADAFPESPAPATPPPNPFFTSTGDSNVISLTEEADDLNAIPEQRLPMWCTRSYTHPSRYVRLHDEAVDLVKYLRPTHEEDFMRKKVVLDLTAIADELFPGSRVLSFGSVVTGLILPMSDVDMTIMYPVVEDDADALHTAMDKLADYIAQKGLCDEAYPQVIKQTKVPIVKFTHRETWIDVDVSFNAPNGRVNSEMVAQYCARLPIAKPMIMLVKYFLQQRSMNEPFTGGLGSYAVSLMVIALLQHHPAFQPGGDPSEVGLGGLLMDFFRFYGVLFDYHTAGISIAPAPQFFPKSQQERNDRSAFLLKDPQNEANNVTASARQLTSIKSAFHHAFLALASDGFHRVPDTEKSAEHPLIKNRPTLLSRVIHIDRAMLDRRNKVGVAYDVWVEKNPTRDVSTYLRRFEDEQISGHEVRETLANLMPDDMEQPGDDNAIYAV
ncbi:Poly(A) RNA polymerase cid14 [Diplonema papillatum]|nr:Poly(A) RNA polymerase cid14 [Diplonema papillatum]